MLLKLLASELFLEFGRGAGFSGGRSTKGSTPVRRSVRRSPDDRSPRSTRPGPIALTGTPGVGKSSTAAFLTTAGLVGEVGDFAVATGCGRRQGRTVTVDLPRLEREFSALHRAVGLDVYVGHLAHLLPIRDVVVLRCHPLELARRLGRARRGTRSDREANVVAEAIDLVLREAVAPRRRVWEVDTTGRTKADVATEVRRCIARRSSSRFGKVDWLADPRVTDYLLDRAR
jgi:adenylate kinase